MPKDGNSRPLTRLPILDKSPEQLFKLWVEAGRIPQQYSNWDHLSNHFLDLVRNKGLTQKAAREQMGVTYRNILGKPILNINESSTGEVRGLDKRAIREDYNIATENFLRNQYGQEAVDAEKARLLNDWNKLSEAERVLMQEAFQKQFHRGHGNAALTGGSISIDNMWPEVGRYNSLHGSDPRWWQPVMDRLGVTQNDLQDYYERQLQKVGLGLGTRPDNALAIAADDYMREEITRTYNPNSPMPSSKYMPVNITGAAKPAQGPSYIPDPTGFSPDRLEMTVDRQNQLADQGVSREAIERWNRNQSPTLSVDNAVAQSGPARQVQGKVNLQTFRVQDKAGITRTSERRVAGTNGGLMPNPNVTRGRVAVAAATRKTAPKPAPTRPPAPAPMPTTRRPAATKPAPNGSRSKPPSTPAVKPMQRVAQLGNRGAIDRQTNATIGDMPGIGTFQSQMRLAD